MSETAVLSSPECPGAGAWGCDGTPGATCAVGCGVQTVWLKGRARGYVAPTRNVSRPPRLLPGLTPVVLSPRPTQVQASGEAEGELWDSRVPGPGSRQLRVCVIPHGHVECGSHYLHAVSAQGPGFQWGGGHLWWLKAEHESFTGEWGGEMGKEGSQ